MKKKPLLLLLLIGMILLFSSIAYGAMASSGDDDPAMGTAANALISADGVLSFEFDQDIDTSEAANTFDVLVNGESVNYTFVEQLDGIIALTLEAAPELDDEVTLVVLATNQQITALVASQEAPVEEPEEESLSTLSAVAGELGAVSLITGSEIEIEFDAAILNNKDAQDTFTILVDGVEVEWEFLSYFDFGTYADRGGVVNVRLKDALDVGQPRVQRRAVVLFANTQDTMGAVAAARIIVKADSTTKTASFVPFYGEIQRGHMSQIDAWGATNAGNSTTNNFSGAIGEPLYTTDYVTKQVGEGINGMVGRAEYLNIPAVNAGLQAVVVGSNQSVYEVPAYRELYVPGETDDLYSRSRIAGSIDKPILVTTADEVMRHDSAVKAENGTDPARPRDNYFNLGEDFLRLYYQFGIIEGSPLFPVGEFTDPDEYRYDKQLQAAYENAKAAGLWPGTVMMESLENYYIYGAMVHFELVPESADGTWQYDRFPVNTREELHDYDNDLYRALCGVHGRYHYFTGTPEQTATSNDFTTDMMKNIHPWFWRSQVDNYVVGSNGQPAERAPLAVEHVRIIASDQIEIKFNREISTISAAATAGNWKVYHEGTEISGVSIRGGYAWRTITLRVTSISLDNGKPYGRAFGGFTQADIDERKVDAGGWIANNRQASANALDYGQLVTLEDAINDWGAGSNGTIEVEYVGTADVEDWAGNKLTKNVKQEADFLPYVGNAYRSPLTGVYIYADTVVEADTIIAGAHMYDVELSNNQVITYQTSAGGLDFPDNPAGVVANGTGHNSSDRNYVNNMLNAGFGTSAVTYDRVGQRIADGSVLAGGGMQIIGGSNFGHHAAMQPTHRNQVQNGFHVWLYVEGWGGTTFQADEVMILKDTQLSRYKNENLIMHEGGHGIDSYTGGSSYAAFVNYDFTAAWVTSVAPENGRRWWNQYNTEGAYLRNRGEFVSTGSTFWHGAMRESFLGINDGTWTPVNTREELYRYDPYAFEAFKRVFFNGELGLWYTDEQGNSRVGDPEYKVIPEDWVLLRDQYAEFSHWTSENDLIAWASSIPEIARDNPYTEEHNSSVNWISWNTPNVWDITLLEDPAIETNKFDFKGGEAYHPADPSPTQSQTHPFFRTGGVQKPVRTAEVAALVEPVYGEIVAGSISVPRPSLVRFEMVDYIGEITSNNVQASFEVKIDGQLTHCYLWEFTEEDDVATVTLRLEWPLDDNAVVEVSTTASEPEAAPTASITAPVEVYLDGNREIHYVISVDDVLRAGAFVVEGKFDLNRLDYLGTEVNLADKYNTFAYELDKAYDAVTGKYWLPMVLQGDQLTSFEDAALLTIKFKVKDSFGIDDLSHTVVGELNSVEVTVLDGSREGITVMATVIKGSADTKFSKIVLKYDINADGKFNMADIVMIMDRYYKVNSNDAAWTAAVRYDIVADGEINTGDLVALLDLLYEH